jgi:hypothetical protein
VIGTLKLFRPTEREDFQNRARIANSNSEAGAFGYRRPDLLHYGHTRHQQT